MSVKQGKFEKKEKERKKSPDRHKGAEQDKREDSDVFILESFAGKVVREHVVVANKEIVSQRVKGVRDKERGERHKANNNGEM